MHKVVLITGCSSGFGYGMALRFARAGYQTYATVRSLTSEGSKKLTSFAAEEQLPLTVLSLDVTDEKSIEKAVSTIIRKEKRIDILINNAGYGYLSPIEDVDIVEMKNLYETNVFGMVRMIKAVVPTMRKNHSGLIINFSSINGIVPFPLFSIYSSTKFAVETLSEGMRFELGAFGIKVVTIEPGSYLTNFTDNRKSPKNMMRQDSPYNKLLTTFFDRYKQTHDQSKSHVASKTADPREVVETVFRVAQLQNPKGRYRVGRDAHKNYWIRKLLPEPVWEWLLHRIYRW